MSCGHGFVCAADADLVARRAWRLRQSRMRRRKCRRLLEGPRIGQHILSYGEKLDHGVVAGRHEPMVARDAGHR